LRRSCSVSSLPDSDAPLRTGPHNSIPGASRPDRCVRRLTLNRPGFCGDSAAWILHGRRWSRADDGSGSGRSSGAWCRCTVVTGRRWARPHRRRDSCDAGQLTPEPSRWRCMRAGRLKQPGPRSVPPAALKLGRRQMVGGAVEPTLVPPIHPLGGGQLHLLEGPPGAAPADELGLVETHHRLGQGVVVAVAAGSDRANSTSLGQALRMERGKAHVSVSRSSQIRRPQARDRRVAPETSAAITSTAANLLLGLWLPSAAPLPCGE
jgi:hypothetical protein